MAFSDARNERDRRDTGRNSSNHGGRDNAGAERRNREAMAKSSGAKASGMSTAAADHLVATGKIRTPSIPAGGVAPGNYATQDEAYNDFAKAVGSYATRGFIDRALDFLGGGFYDAQEPMAGNPRSFAGGDYHTSSNPGSILGGFAGMLAPGSGTLVGPALGGAYTALGLPDIWHGGYSQPDYRSGLLGNSSQPMGGSFADIGGTSTGPLGSLFGGGHTYASGSNPASSGGWAGTSRPLTGGGTGNGYSPFQSTQRTTPRAPAPTMSSIPQQAPQPQNLWARPWPGQDGGYSPFGQQQNKWSWG